MVEHFFLGQQLFCSNTIITFDQCSDLRIIQNTISTIKTTYSRATIWRMFWTEYEQADITIGAGQEKVWSWLGAEKETTGAGKAPHGRSPFC